MLARVRADLSFAVVDGILIAFAYMAALAFRSLDGELPAVWWPRVLQALPVLVAVHLTFNVVFGTYGHVWEYASIAEARRVVASTFWASALLIGSSLVLGIRPVPLSVLVAGALITTGCLGVVRFRSRLFSFHRSLSLEATDRALVIGTGRIAADVVRHATDGPESLNVVGFVSPEETETVRRLAGLPVLGSLSDIGNLIREYRIAQVVVAVPGANDLARELVDLVVDVDVKLRIVPGLDEVLNGSGIGPDIRDLIIDDLLQREVVATDYELVESTLAGKRVLVTGAGGSIGSEVVRQVLKYSPELLVAMDNDETHLHDGMLTWEPPSGTRLVPALVDIRDIAALEYLVKRFKPDVVFHAAAHKHVPILQMWPAEAVKTNVNGTANLLQSSKKYGVERFVLISTDKTVDPRSVMGASKRIAEMLVQSEARDNPDCQYSSVRFGNVLGSRGSVVPTFMAQIRSGGPVTITDERMTRYFMTTSEAVGLVLQAGALSSEGEVFVLDMGEPVRIVDLAHRMIRLAGKVPGRDIEVKVTGARPGEKLEESLSHGDLLPSSHPKINIAEAGFPTAKNMADIRAHLDSITDLGRPSQMREFVLSVANTDWSTEEIVDLNEMEETDQWI